MGAKWFGASVKRKEDPAFLTGKGRYVDDIHLPGMLDVVVLRSPHPHAMIRAIDTSRALALPGVHAVITYADLPEPMRRQTVPLLVPNRNYVLLRRFSAKDLENSGLQPQRQL